MTVLSLQGKMFLFCGKTCCDDYKKKNKVIAMCDYCKLQKIIKETVRFSGVDKPFCSEGKGKSSVLSTDHVVVKYLLWAGLFIHNQFSSNFCFIRYNLKLFN